MIEIGDVGIILPIGILLCPLSRAACTLRCTRAHHMSVSISWVVALRVVIKRRRHFSPIVWISDRAHTILQRHSTVLLLLVFDQDITSSKSQALAQQHITRHATNTSLVNVAPYFTPRSHEHTICHHGNVAPHSTRHGARDTFHTFRRLVNFLFVCLCFCFCLFFLFVCLSTVWDRLVRTFLSGRTLGCRFSPSVGATTYACTLHRCMQGPTSSAYMRNSFSCSAVQDAHDVIHRRAIVTAGQAALGSDTAVL